MAIDTSYLNMDFEVYRTNSCKALKILDLSNWADAADIAAYISITAPGATQAVSHIFIKEKLNIFNSNNLNLSDVTDYSMLAPLPDGVYTITLGQCLDDPSGVTKYHLQDCQIRCRIARKLIALDLTCEPCRKELLHSLQDITLFLDAAQAQTDRCNVNKAMEYYQRALLMLSRISDDHNQPCNC